MQMDGAWVANEGRALRYRYNGKELNEDFGLDLYSFKARWYDPGVGRFTGVDPIGDEFPHLSTYNYAGNEPIANIDLWGLQPVSVVKKKNSITSDRMVTKPIRSFLSGALSMDEKILRNMTWQPGGLAWQFSRPSAITIGSRIQYDPKLASKGEVYWTKLVAHEAKHVHQYDEKGFVGFLSQYLGDYDKNLTKGMNQYQAYLAIPFEEEAYSVEGILHNFFSNQQNQTGFINILNDNSLTENQKANQMEILGIEKIAIPQLESFKGYFESILHKGNESIINILIQALDNRIQEQQARADEIRNK